MTVIDEYLEKITPEQKIEFTRICKIVRETVPEAVETLSYGIPTFKYKDKYLVGFYAYKKHLSLFPTSGPINELSYELKKFQLSKGTIQFTLDNIIPNLVIKDIIENRIKAIDNNQGYSDDK